MSKLIVLGLLSYKSMHGYEIQNIIEKTSMDKWTNVQTGSIYYALNSMEKDGLIVAVSEEIVSGKIRKVYDITTGGREELKRLVEKTLPTSPTSLKSDFKLSLSWMFMLDRGTIIEILEVNLDNLIKEKQRVQEVKECHIQSNNSILLLTMNNTLEVLNLDINYISQLISLIKDESIDLDFFKEGRE